MAYDSTIAAALHYYECMMLKAKWEVKPPEDATEAEIANAEFVTQCFSDMKHSWQDFIQEVSSMNMHGFCVNEIVLRRRLRSEGSKYNDGKIGISKLPIRAQDTIDKWIYSDDGRELIGVRQNLNLQGGIGRFENYSGSQEIVIARDKFLLFRTGKRKENPYGESILNSCYFSWKYKTNVEAQEGVGVQRDLSGLPHAEVPAAIMASDATPEQKSQLLMWQNIVRNVQSNDQSGLVTPLVYDQESKLPLYKFSLLKGEGGRAYDTSAIKLYYANSILTAMSADVLILGQSTTGSYALGTMKGTMAAMAIEAKLLEIAGVINKHLIPILGFQNGWDMTRLPELTFEDLESLDLAVWSQALQRAASVGLVSVDRKTLNKVNEMLGIDMEDGDAPVDATLLTMAASRSGDGLAVGKTGNGTSDAVAATDTSSSNLANK